jgi:PAS domain S-box-containing protein
MPKREFGTTEKLAALGVLTVLILLFSAFCLTRNLQAVFPHLYYIPIIIAAFWFGKKGVLYAILLAALYIGVVLTFSNPDLQTLLAAVGRALFFIGVALVIAILSIMISRQHETLEVSEAKFRGIWESIQAAIVLVDAETHTIIAANPEAERMTGFSESEMIGHVCHKFICPAEEGKCPISDLGQKIDRAERMLLARDGKKVPVYKTVSDVTIGGKRCFIENFVEIKKTDDT